ncbi:MAG: SDR family NAD(P)-dependent oxidoreductase [Candidatus Dormiibacterota bacterium]
MQSFPPAAERGACAESGAEPTAEKTALVTGSSSGIGRATALALLRYGYPVIAAMRDPNKAGPLLDAASAQGDADRIEVLVLDLLQDTAVIEATVRSGIRRVGHLDVLVNNAGTAEGGAVEEIPMRLWRRVMETNFFGPLACIRAVLPGMREQGSGAILNVTSINGRVSGAGGSPPTPPPSSPLRRCPRRCGWRCCRSGSRG